VSHKLLTLLLLSACFLGVNATLWGQNAIPNRAIRGYLDPRTGIFHSIPHPDTLDEDAPPPAKTTFTGSVVMNFTITVSTVFASTTPIACIGEVGLNDSGSTNNILEVGGSTVTRGTGTTVNCSVTIPYSWSLASAGTDKVRLFYAVIAPVDFTRTVAFPSREGAQTLGTIAVPISGTITTEAIKARI
jgi:hypothetical protein